MLTVKQTLLQGVFLLFGAVVASACAQEEAPGGPTQTRSDIVLNDRAYEVELRGSVSEFDARVRAALVELELDVARAVGSGSERVRQYRAGNGERIVDVELSVQRFGRSKISVSAARVTPMRNAEVVEDPAFAKEVLQRIVDQGQRR